MATSARPLTVEAVKGTVDFGILTIREDEFEAVLERFPPFARVMGRRAYNLHRMELAEGGSYLVAVVRCIEQGNTEALDAARDLLEELAPQWLLVVGIAGGVPSEERGLGDVVVSTRVVDFSVEAALHGGESELALGGGAVHKDAAVLVANLPAMKGELRGWSAAGSIGVERPALVVGEAERFYGDHAWQEKTRKALARHVGRTEPIVTAGAIASSDRLMKDTERLEVLLRAARQVVAVEMESAGVYRGAFGRGVPSVAIRGLSDVVGFRREPEWTRYACHTAAAFTAAFLRTRPIEPRGEGSAGEGEGPRAGEQRGAEAAGPTSGATPERSVEPLVDELASVIADSDMARLVVHRAGFPAQLVPRFERPLTFWAQVIAEAQGGMVRGGVAAVVEQALRLFPDNPVLAAHRVAEEEPEIGAYRRSMLERHRCLKLAGFGERVKVAIELNELYVPLDVVLDQGRGERVIYSDAHHAKAHVEQYGRCQRISMAKAFGLAREYGKRGLVLLGDPGSGKTTQLRRVLLQLLSGPEDGGGPEAIGLPADTLPVFLPLRNLRAGDSLAELMQRELDGPVVKAPAGLAERLLERGRLLLLFDGLDEVADQDERERVARWIEDLLADTGVREHWFLVSSRYAGYTPNVKLDSEFLELHLRPLTDEQVRGFVENWYRVVEAEEARIEGVAAAPGRAAELVGELEVLARGGEAQAYAMTRNPLLLTAICLVHRRGKGALPQGREALYHECTTVLLEGWRKRDKRLPVVLPAEQARKVLQPVALWMHGEDGRTQASAAELREPVRRGFEGIGQPELDPDALLRRIRDESGLLTGWGLDRYGFMHLGFQEYLAALELREAAAGSRAAEVVRTLAGRFDRTWWREVIVLMFATGDGGMFERLMREAVAGPELREWMGSEIMSRLLGQHGAQALGGLDAVVLRHADADVRAWWRRVRGLERAAGESRLAPRGGVELVRIPGGRFLMGSPEGEEGRYEDEGPQHWVDLEELWLARTPVTNAQYGEYLKANPGAKEPEYWGVQRYNQAQQPVVGVSWKEAKAYCEWAGLRLPTETQWEYACRAGTMTRYWSGDGEEDLARVGWYGGNSGGRLHAVGELEPNAFGLYDMHGNVDEWCEDTWVSNYEQAVHRAGDGLRTQPVGDANRVVRGGDFDGGARNARSAFRDVRRPVFRTRWLGFRPAHS